MKQKKQLAGVVLALGLAVAAAPAFADRGRDGNTFRASLESYSEVPAVSSPGEGSFRARVSRDGQSIDWELEYGDLQGTPFMAHIHFGQRGVNGGIVIWLCGQAPATPPAGTQTCPTAGKVSGTIVAPNVTPNAGALAQLIAPGELAEVIAAMREGVTYVNVHTNLAPGGEIRGQIGGNSRGGFPHNHH